MTELEAVNKALGLLGVAPVGSLSDDIQAARVMSAIFESTKLAVLAEFPWSFASRREALVPASSGVTPAPGWMYAFEYPAGAAALYQVYDGRNEKLEYVAENGRISAMRPAALAEYTVNPPMEDWPQLAAEAFVVRLASDACVTLDGNAQLAMTLLEKYRLMCQAARANSMNEENAPRRRRARYAEARD
jgi:hypothetical protein